VIQDPTFLSRLTITGTNGGFGTDTHGAVGYALYSGIDHVNVTLGSGADQVTFVSTPAGTTTTLDTGAGDDRVAVRSLNGATTIWTRDGNDTVYIGSGAGLLARRLHER